MIDEVKEEGRAEILATEKCKIEMDTEGNIYVNCTDGEAKLSIQDLENVARVAGIIKDDEP